MSAIDIVSWHYEGSLFYQFEVYSHFKQLFRQILLYIIVQNVDELNWTFFAQKRECPDRNVEILWIYF